MFVFQQLFKSNVLRFSRRIATSGRLSSADLVTHRDTGNNNSATEFLFSDANMKRLEALIKNYPVGCDRSVLGAALDLAQRQIGWVPISAMNKIADLLCIPRIRVYESATFYSMVKRRFRGQYNVRVCISLPCKLLGSDELLDCVQCLCGAKAGHNSTDGLFGVDEVMCQGACANAPVMVIDDDYYEDMTLHDAERIIKNLRNGCISPSGPQSGRHAAEPFFGLTSLTGPLPPVAYNLHPDLY